jgi:hypothetical protein
VELFAEQYIVFFGKTDFGRLRLSRIGVGVSAAIPMSSLSIGLLSVFPLIIKPFFMAKPFRLIMIKSLGKAAD